MSLAKEADEVAEHWSKLKHEISIAMLRDWARLKRASPLAALLAIWFFMAGFAIGWVAS